LITINAMGKQCPVPVIEAKKALETDGSDGVVIRVDNFVAVQNLENMAGGLGYGFSYVKIAESDYEATISKNYAQAVTVSAEKAPENYSNKVIEDAQDCAPACGPTVVIKSNKMGEGAEELGKTLLKGFIYSLTELETAPQAVIFINSGAYLTTEGSNSLEDLKKLTESGTEVLTCGACLNYYELTEKLIVGEVTNMYAITEKMSKAQVLINL